MDLLRHCGFLKERVACKLIRDIVLGIKSLHDIKLVHRDIKPENILLTGNGKAKLADFGWSNSFDNDNVSRKTFCGTADYLAPEMILGLDHDDSLDLWCLGVLVYELLFGKAPFGNPKVDPNSPEYQVMVERSISKLDYSIPKHPSVTKEAVDLIKHLLKKKPKDRMKIQEIMNHKWFRKMGFSFDPSQIELEPSLPDLTLALEDSLHDPFAKSEADQQKALEEEIREEQEQMQRARAKSIGESILTSTQDPESLPKVRRGSRSTGVLREMMAESIKEKSPPITPNKPAYLKLIYKNNVALVDGKDNEQNIDIIEVAGSIDWESPSNTPDIVIKKKSSHYASKLAQEIDAGYEKFDAGPVEVAVQTVPLIMFVRENDYRVGEVEDILNSTEDFQILLQMIEEQQAKKSILQNKMHRFVTQLQQKDILIDQLTKRVNRASESKRVTEQQIQREAKALSEHIDAKQSEIDKLKKQKEQLQALLRN